MASDRLDIVISTGTPLDTGRLQSSMNTVVPARRRTDNPSVDDIIDAELGVTIPLDRNEFWLADNDHLSEELRFTTDADEARRWVRDGDTVRRVRVRLPLRGCA